MRTHRLSLVLVITIANLIFTVTVEAQNLTLRNDGIEFPDGTIQTTAADNGWIAAVQALQDQINAQQAMIAALETGLAAANGAITDLQADLDAAEQEIADMRASTVFDLAPYVRVDYSNLESVDGPHVLFEGVNLHLRSGSGDTDLAVGLGNLIIGYNEWMFPRDRSGSHNLVIGKDFEFPSRTELLVDSGRNIVLEGYGDIDLKGMDITAHAQDDFTLSSDRFLDIHGNTWMDITSDGAIIIRAPVVQIN